MIFFFYFSLAQKLETELKESEPELSKLKETSEEVKSQVSQHDAGLVNEHIRSVLNQWYSGSVVY